jgi:hypothetical protein
VIPHAPTCLIMPMKMPLVNQLVSSLTMVIPKTSTSFVTKIAPIMPMLTLHA